ncbi:nucleoside transporter C-terminal domain-containing protein [Paraburkholderia sp. MPAMCS5]|uniref:NupC/NupG family nucleoside CNT transporter n=1 Tax=Paraburkholderia sp. MPAMCS5 TaxID=3112563 RepID=UPI002E195068|nr:nucleoside transporter C-terminal domain-containing protein [Paraburkholderia sp. MPAMCS5]
MNIVRGLLGMLLLLLVGYCLSMNRREIKPRTVLAALAAQVGIGALVLFVPAGRMLLAAVARGANAVLEMGQQGLMFLFGGLVGDKMFVLFGAQGFAFGLRVLPMIIFVTSLIAVLYYFGIMTWLIRGVGTVFSKCLGVSRIEGCAASATVFIGHTELPAFTRPFIRQLSKTELFAVMSSGMASVSGAAVAGYAGLGVNLQYLLAASFMAIPGGLVFGKLICPSSQAQEFDMKKFTFDDKPAANVIEAAASGAAVGLKIAVSIGAMLVAFIGLIALANMLVGVVAGWFGFEHLTLQSMLGTAFAPLAWAIGVPWQDAAVAGNFIGEKLILNEFIAYGNLAPYLQDAHKVAAAGLQVLDPTTIAILSFALCGFANFSSIAMLTGGFGAVVPELRGDVARFGLRALAAGTLSNLMSATIAGIFLSMT